MSGRVQGRIRKRLPHNSLRLIAAVRAIRAIYYESERDIYTKNVRIQCARCIVNLRATFLARYLLVTVMILLYVYFTRCRARKSILTER